MCCKAWYFHSGWSCLGEAGPGGPGFQDLRPTVEEPGCSQCPASGMLACPLGHYLKG